MEERACFNTICQTLQAAIFAAWTKGSNFNDGFNDDEIRVSIMKPFKPDHAIYALWMDLT
jgi:hypothetical protein